MGMNNKKIGKFIQSLRLELNMTQKDLAEKLYITDKAVSKWETGNSIPDVSILESLSNILNVSVTELINGERIDNEKLECADRVIIDNLNMDKKRMKKRNKIIITLSIILLASLLFILGIFFYNNYNKIVVYQFDGESENFGFAEGDVVYSNNGNIFNIGWFYLKNDSELDIDTIERAEITVLFDNMGGRFGSSFNKYNTFNQTFYEWLNNFRNSQFITQDSNVDNWYGILERDKFPSNMTIIITYTDSNQNFTQEKFKINYKVLASSRLFG